MSEQLPGGRAAEDTSAEQRDDRPCDVPPHRVTTSEALLAGAQQLAIRHNQTIYFLRQTRFGKLILTK